MDLGRGGRGVVRVDGLTICRFLLFSSDAGIIDWDRPESRHGLYKRGHFTHIGYLVMHRARPPSLRISSST